MFPASCASKSDRKRLEQVVYLAVAVGKRIEVHADFVEQRQVKVRQRPGFVVLDVTSAFHSGCGATGDKDRQIRVVMDVRIADAAAVEIKRMIEERAVSFRRRFQLLEKFGEQ